MYTGPKTEVLQAHVYPSTKAKLQEWANEEGITLSRLLFILIREHIWEKKPWLRDMPDPPLEGYVYLIKVGDLYKIGRAGCYKQRIRNMKLDGRPTIIKVKKHAEYKVLEKRLHAKFRHQRRHGEWFSLTPEEVIQAKEFMTSW